MLRIFQEKIFNEPFTYKQCPLLVGGRTVTERSPIGRDMYLILYNKNVKITSNSAYLKTNLNYAIVKTYFNIINLHF